MPWPNPGTMPLGLRFRLLWRLRLFRFFRSLGLTRRQIAAKSQCDPSGRAEAALAGNAVVVQVIGVEKIDRPKLQSDMTKDPIVKTTARRCRHGRISCRSHAHRRIQTVPPNQSMHKARHLAGPITEHETRPKHVRKTAAIQSGAFATAELVAAEVCLSCKTIKQVDRNGCFPAIQSQSLRGTSQSRVRGQIKVEIRVPAENVDCRCALSGSNPYHNRKSEQNDGDKILHVS